MEIHSLLMDLHGWLMDFHNSVGIIKFMEIHHSIHVLN